jgi:uncharacterized protein YeaO (DUF488 family)
MSIKIKRIYEPYESSDGYRVLVDRLWPRGVEKVGAHIDLWLKEVAPSTALRQWFNHDEAKWNEFVGRYQRELKGSVAILQLISLKNQHRTITLVYSAKNEKYNQAVALMKMLGR